MKNHCGSIKQRLLLFAVLAFVSVVLGGCFDPAVSSMEAEHQRLGRLCEQELRQGGFASPVAPQLAPQPLPQTGILFPAQ